MPRLRPATSITAGTAMHRSRLPLTAWFWAAHLMTTHSNGMSARQLEDQLGVTYKTAWLLTQKLRRSLVVPYLVPLRSCRSRSGGNSIPRVFSFFFPFFSFFFLFFFSFYFFFLFSFLFFPLLFHSLYLFSLSFLILLSFFSFFSSSSFFSFLFPLCALFLSVFLLSLILSFFFPSALPRSSSVFSHFFFPCIHRSFSLL